jgi:hypothetical protein
MTDVVSTVTGYGMPLKVSTSTAARGLDSLG